MSPPTTSIGTALSPASRAATTANRVSPDIFRHWICLLIAFSAGHKSNDCQNEKVEDSRYGGGNSYSKNDSYKNVETSSFGAVAAEGDWASGGGGDASVGEVGVSAVGNW